MNSDLFSPLFSDAETAAIFSDAQLVRMMLMVEAGLARVQAHLGIIPQDAADRIATAVDRLNIDMGALRAGVEKAGVPTIDLIRQLREHVGGEAAAYVHWGATTQDIMDTAVVLQLRAALVPIEQRLNRLIGQFAQLADSHRHTLMVGRTHSQAALPITFGLKVAGWLAPLVRHRERLTQLKPRLLVVQFGGAAGTLASIAGDGLAVMTGLAEALNLGVPVMTWHTQRDSLVELAGWLSLVTGSLAKMAQDIILMAQSEVGEIRESHDNARGGSSTMPQKSNPIISEGIIAAARTNASHLAALHHAMIQEHERATHGWQMEWLNLPQMVILTAATLNKAVFLSENLVVDVERMRHNVRATNGLMLAERLTFALVPLLGRAEAKQLVKEACQIAATENRHLVDVVSARTQITLDWDTLRDEASYLGVTHELIDRALHSVYEAESLTI